MSDNVRRGHMKYAIAEVNWRVGGEVGTQIGRRLDGWMNDNQDGWFVKRFWEMFWKDLVRVWVRGRVRSWLTSLIGVCVKLEIGDLWEVWISNWWAIGQVVGWFFRFNIRWGKPLVRARGQEFGWEVGYWQKLLEKLCDSKRLGGLLDERFGIRLGDSLAASKSWRRPCFSQDQSMFPIYKIQL